MLFILLSTIIALAIPITYDIKKNGSNNILHQSGEEILQLKPVADVRRSLNTAYQKAKQRSIFAVVLVIIRGITKLILQFFKQFFN
jgi:hypothetical protein